jgi:hypothetical protein
MLPLSFDPPIPPLPLDPEEELELLMLPISDPLRLRSAVSERSADKGHAHNVLLRI